MSKKLSNHYATHFASGGKIKCHTLKSWPIHFQPVLSKIKTAEIRLNDRDYQAGDFVILSEYVPKGEPMSFGGGIVRDSAGEFTGAWVKICITHVSPLSNIFDTVENGEVKPNRFVLLSFAWLESGQLSMKDMQQLDLLLGQI